MKSEFERPFLESKSKSKSKIVQSSMPVLSSVISFFARAPAASVRVIAEQPEKESEYVNYRTFI